MKPDRELDVVIATKIMGIEVQKDQIAYGGWLGVKKSDDPWDYFIGGTNNLIPNYSTDIAAAWEVVEKLKPELDMHVETSFRGWICGFGHVQAAQVYGDTAPHAICLAALKAVGHEV